MSGDPCRRRRARGLAALVCCAILWGRANSALGEEHDQAEPVAPKCLTPAASDALRSLVGAKSLQAALGAEFTLERADVSANQIELGVEDRDHHSYGVTLAVPGALAAAPDRQGRLFLFRLQTPFTPPNPSAAAALLAAATVVDHALPESSLVDCSGSAEPERSAPPPSAAEPPREPWRFPLALALLSAALQVAIIIAAVVYGLRAIRSRGPIDPNA